MSGTTTTAQNTNQHMYLELRSSTQGVAKCYAHLNALMAKHSDAQATLAGVTGTEDQFMLTIDIDLGPRERIAEPSDEATFAYGFVTAVYEDMFEFLPQYTAEPDADQRHAATAFLDTFAAIEQTIAARAI